MNELPDCQSGAQRLPALAVVVPMLDELAGAERCVQQITKELARLDPVGCLVVVDDGSTDGTGALLDRLEQSNHELRVVHHSGNRGYGVALRSGAAEAQRAGSDWVLFMDSDLTNPPEDIARFVEAIAGPVDCVKASRYAKGGAARGVPLKRQVISRVGNAIAGLLFGLPLSDLTNGFRAIRLASFLNMPLREKGFAIIAEEAYWAGRMGLRWAEVPTVLTNRDRSLSGSSFRYRPSVLYLYARYPAKAFAERIGKSMTRVFRTERGGGR